MVYTVRTQSSRQMMLCFIVTAVKSQILLRLKLRRTGPRFLRLNLGVYGFNTCKFQDFVSELFMFKPGISQRTCPRLTNCRGREGRQAGSLAIPQMSRKTIDLTPKFK
jgi:hypothetical protein